MFQLNQSEAVRWDNLRSLELAAMGHSVPDYVLGNGQQEQERLKVQAGFLEKWTEQFFVLAGLRPGMRVLDLGCGMGDVALLAARIVGHKGSVTAIDRDDVIVEKARARAHRHGRAADIEFICTDVLNFDDSVPFDAVVGRYFLLYQRDPVVTLLHAAEQVRSGGIIVVHEMDFANPIRSYPDGTLFGRMCALIAETFHRSGCWADLGLHLTRLFLNAGLPWPQIKAEVPVGGEPGSYIYPWITETLRSLLPRMEQFGLASTAELGLDTLLARMEAEALARQAQLVGPLQFAAWARNP